VATQREHVQDSHSPAEELNEESARRALKAAGTAAGIDTSDANLIRIGSNAVFRLPDDVIARIAPSADLLANAEKQVKVSNWLQQQHYPAVRALPVAQPVVADGRVATFWESVSGVEEYAPIADVAALIRQLHELPSPPSTIPMTNISPFGGLDSPTPRFPGLDAPDEKYLVERLLWARSTFDTLPYELSRGHIHGDANVGNVLRSSDGKPVMIDLDSFSTGPREWDLIQTAIFYDRLGWHTEAEYRTFVDVYGYNLLQWEGYCQLAEMRELAMTAWLSKKAAQSASAAREAARRIRAIKTGASRRDWAPY
jgi:aminoglycoside phosphotransferase (APT) family kinase protein